MFSYIDPSIRERLVADGRLLRIEGPGDAPAINLLGPIPLPLDLGDQSITAQWYAFVRRTELARVDELAADLRSQNGQHLFATLASYMAVNSVLVLGDPAAALARGERPLVRVHSNCLTGDVFGSQRCECGPQLLAAIDRIHHDPAGGYLVYMSGHEGRGIGLWAKAVTYLLQDAGEDTYQANRSLGLPDDCRDFTDAAVVLRHFLADAPFRLLTNNPKKIDDLTAHGLANITREKHVVGVSDWNRRYLAAKRDWGHGLDAGDIE